MKICYLHLILESDATFGRGDGVAGVVDSEVQHDELGCPYLAGRTLKGLLVNECADILAALPQEGKERWYKAANRLFGQPGSGNCIDGGLSQSAIVSVGPASLPQDLRQALAQQQTHTLRQVAPDEREQKANLFRLQTLEALTAIRNQTAMQEDGVPREHSLRTQRVILRQTPFVAALRFQTEPEADDLALLAACVKALRRAGSGRNRGRGRLRAELLDQAQKTVTEVHYQRFKQEALQCTP